MNYMYARISVGASSAFIWRNLYGAKTPMGENSFAGRKLLRAHHNFKIYARKLGWAKLLRSGVRRE